MNSAGGKRTSLFLRRIGFAATFVLDLRPNLWRMALISFGLTACLRPVIRFCVTPDRERSNQCPKRKSLTRSSCSI